MRITILTGQIEELQGVVPIGKFNERGVITASNTRSQNLEVTAKQTFNQFPRRDRSLAIFSLL